VRLVLVDSHDSFTHNLVQAFRSLGATVVVVQSDNVDTAQIAGHRPDRLVLGPGPGRPEDCGCLLEVVHTFAGRVPILGVCLGHQAIGLAYGGDVVRHTIVHGHATPIVHDGTGVFSGLPESVDMTRYHSLVVASSTLPDCLRATAWSKDGALMGIRHRTLPVHGVQFHPESVLSGSAGMALLRNFAKAGSLEAQVRAPAVPATA
jgi:anthranilate synthase component II